MNYYLLLGTYNGNSLISLMGLKLIIMPVCAQFDKSAVTRKGLVRGLHCWRVVTAGNYADLALMDVS